MARKDADMPTITICPFDTIKKKALLSPYGRRSRNYDFTEKNKSPLKKIPISSPPDCFHCSRKARRYRAADPITGSYAQGGAMSIIKNPAPDPHGV